MCSDRHARPRIPDHRRPGRLSRLGGGRARSGSLADGAAYLVGYAPAMFRMGPMAQGWRIACPEELMQRALHD